MLSALIIVMLGQSYNIDNIVKQASVKHGVEPALIKAIIKAESDFNPYTTRYEAHLKDTSWGLMQVLLNTAREITNNKNLTSKELQRPDINVDIGTTYIAKQLKRYNGNIKDTIAAYNAGTAKKRSSGEYTNQIYVSKVYSYYKRYKAVKTIKGVAMVVPIAVLGLVGYVVSTRRI